MHKKLIFYYFFIIYVLKNDIVRNLDIIFYLIYSDFASTLPSLVEMITEKFPPSLSIQVKHQ